jgi:hypothetical protein
MKHWAARAEKPQLKWFGCRTLKRGHAGSFVPIQCFGWKRVQQLIDRFSLDDLML